MRKKRLKMVHIQFQFTKDRKKDALRFLIAGLFFFSLVTVYWNRAPTPLKNLEQGYKGFVLKGTHAQKMLDEQGVALIKTWLEQYTTPTINPVTILTQYRRINNPMNHYELAIGMTTSAEDGFREYAIYQSGQTIYLQVEPMGIDRVLHASFSAGDLEKALEPYIKGEFKSTPTVFP